ncbi:MAG: nucleoside deaminase [Herpetosiphon sp.]|nr:nucleoside deaminase [Herpetosiphon sp.]
MLKPHDETFLRKSIALAQSARDRGNHPFGALVVHVTNHVVVESRNTVETDHDVTAHAEMNAVREAYGKYTAGFLADCTIYTSTEPCPMCAGAIFWSGIGRVVYALSEEQLYAITGATTESLPIACREILAQGGRTVVVEGPALEAEARKVHEGFWR